MKDHPLNPMMERASQESLFLGCRLSQYVKAQELDLCTLAEIIHCQPDRIPHLWLCRNPETDDDVRRIAQYVPCNYEALAGVLADC